MLDRWVMPLFSSPLKQGAAYLKDAGVRPDQVSVAGFCLGMMSVVALYLHYFWVALLFIVLNRLGDGLDGCLARMTEATDAGGYLDITLDFIFYSAVVLGFCLVDPVTNGLPAAVLLFTFIGTGSSFLAFAVMAERRGLQNSVYKNKGFYYLSGLAEGTETIIFMVLFCLFPGSFPALAYCFAALCLLTVISRVMGGYFALIENSK